MAAAETCFCRFGFLKKRDNMLRYNLLHPWNISLINSEKEDNFNCNPSVLDKATDKGLASSSIASLRKAVRCNCRNNGATALVGKESYENTSSCTVL
eukprot:5652620-Amphidinium_carterae.1